MAPLLPLILQAVHRRAQQLLVFFIDGATPIDQSEPEWDIFIAVQEAEDGTPLMVNRTLDFSKTRVCLRLSRLMLPRKDSLLYVYYHHLILKPCLMMLLFEMADVKSTDETSMILRFAIECTGGLLHCVQGLCLSR